MRRLSRLVSWSLGAGLLTLLTPGFEVLAAASEEPGNTVSPAVSEAEPQGQETRDPVLATFHGGTVRLSDVWREVRHLPKDERRYRQVEGVPIAQQWRDWLHRIALRQLAQQHAAELGLELDEQLREQGRQEVRSWWLTRWRADAYDLTLEPPDEAALAERVQSELQTWPARIQLSHIFLQAETDAEVEQARERLAAWRSELDTLEAFRAIASEHSDSESARKEGKLGWLQKGWLPSTIEDVLYELPVGTMSQPLEARGGIHLFWIEGKDAARSQSLEIRLEREREQERTLALHALRDQRAAEGPKVEIGDGEWPRVSVGDWTLSGEVLRSVHAKGAATGQETAARVGRDEALLQRALSGGFLDADEQARRRDLEANPLLTALIAKLVGSSVPEPTEAEERALYDSRPDGYQTQILREVRVLKSAVPEEADPLEFFGQLETLRGALSSGALSWEQAAERVPGATFEHWPSRPALEIASRTSPFLMRQIGPMAAGQMTEVIQDGPDFYIVEVVSRQEPRRRSFDEVRHLVVRELKSKAERRARSRTAFQLLAEAELTLTAYGEAFLADPPDPFQEAPETDPATTAEIPGQP